MGTTTTCIESGHCRNGLNSLNPTSTRLSRAGGYGGLAIAVLLMALGVARAQTSPAGQPQIAHSAATTPISIAVVIGQTPVTIPESSAFVDGSGAMTTLLPGGPVGAKFVAAHSQLFNRGNFRIAITAPSPLGPTGETTFEGNTPSGDNDSTATPQWILTVLKDPTG